MNSSRLLTIKKNQIKMLAKRKFIIPNDEKDILDMDAPSFIHYINNIKQDEHPLNKIYTSENDETKKIAVFYLQPDGNDNIKKDTLNQNFISLLSTHVANKYILILLGKLKSVAEIQKKYPMYDITIFTHYELLFDVTEHIFSEKIVGLCINAERTELLKKIKIDNLRKLAYNDPVVKFWGYSPGDIVWCKNINYDERALVSQYIIPKVITLDSIST